MSNEKWAITPLGGVGGVGNACFLFEYNGISVVVDCGLDPKVFHESVKEDSKFPFVVSPPRLDILDKGIADGQNAYALITHGHLDHVGAVGELLKRGIKGERLMMSSWTGKLLRRYADNLGVPMPDNSPPPWKIIRERDRSITNKLAINKSGLRTYIFPLNHSTHGTFGVSFNNGKKVVYLTDFKFYGYLRNIPDGNGSFKDGRAWLDGILDEIRGKSGVDCLLLDVMNSDLEDFTPPEEEVLQSLEGIINEAPGRVFISVISSNFQRIEEITKMSRRLGKKIAFVGSSMNAAYGMLQDRLLLFAREAEGREDEYLPSVIYRDRELQQELKDFLGVVNPKQAEIILISGTQGESNSAASRFAQGTLTVREEHFESLPSDWFIVSGRVIPDNEPAQRPTVLKLAGRCQKVILHNRERAKLGITGFANIIEGFVHVSGHGQLGDMGRALERLNPGIVVPIHAPWDRVKLFEEKFGGKYNIQRLDVGQTLEI